MGDHDGPPSLPTSIAEWERLALESGSLPTQDAPWTLACIEAFQTQPRLTVCHDGRQLTALAPLVGHGITTEFAGGRETGEVGDLLARSPEDLTQLADRLADAGRPLMLERIPADSATVKALRAAFAGQATIELEEKASFPTITLEAKWQEPGGGLSSSRRSALRRSRRKGDKHGEIKAEILSPQTHQVPALLDQALMIESRSWKGEHGTAVAFSPRLTRFYERYCMEMAARGALRIEFLRVSDRAVAMQLAVRWNNRHWLLKIGYDAAFAEMSPGQLLLAESVAVAARDGLAAYELFGSRDDWTDAWTKDVRHCVRVCVLPAGVRGSVARATIRGRIAAERAGGIVRRRKRALIAPARARYMAGADVENALAEVRRYEAAGYAITVGFSNGIRESPDEVMAENFKLAERLPAGAEVALKLIAAGGDRPVLDELLALCNQRELTLHIDAVGPEAAGLTLETATRLAVLSPGRVGCTLPGRWKRSAADAEALMESTMRVRVVKGELEDRSGVHPDPVSGCIRLAEILAEGTCHVEIATQDAPLARRALEILLEHGSSCELQVLHGMASAAAVRVGRQLAVPVRAYLPYGAGRLPYTREELMRDPRLLGTVFRDVCVPVPRRPPGA